MVSSLSQLLRRFGEALHCKLAALKLQHSQHSHSAAARHMHSHTWQPAALLMALLQAQVLARMRAWLLWPTCCSI